MQTCTARFLGTFLPDLRVIPPPIVQFVARQLDIANPLPLLEQYQASQMRFDHLVYLKEKLHYEDFTEPTATFGLVRHLYVRTWTSNERPSVLFEDAVTWLRDHRVLLPGITTLTRFIARFRDRVAQRLWQALGNALTPEQRTQLEAVLTTPAEDNGPRLDTLRRGETRVSSPGLLRALARLESARSVGVGEIDLAQIPVQRLKALAAYAITSKAARIADLTEERRLATLLAFVQSTMKTACDDALDILDGLTDTMLRDASRRVARNGCAPYAILMKRRSPWPIVMPNGSPIPIGRRRRAKPMSMVSEPSWRRRCNVSRSWRAPQKRCPSRNCGDAMKRSNASCPSS